ncbi:MAG: hypothetical protein PHG00_12845 [Methylococcales bacterium]|nr:hypothetical protein [Methylococcales bacterium]
MKMLLISCLAISGCKSALLEMRDDNQRIAERVTWKESELIGLKDQNQQFLYEKNKLLSELNQKNLTLDELGAQVDKLKAANFQMKAVTDAERAKKAKLSRSLDEYSRKIKHLERDDQLGIEEKKKKNEELKQQIKDRMIRDLESN